MLRKYLTKVCNMYLILHFKRPSLGVWSLNQSPHKVKEVFGGVQHTNRHKHMLTYMIIRLRGRSIKKKLIIIKKIQNRNNGQDAGKRPKANQYIYKISLRQHFGSHLGRPPSKSLIRIYYSLSSLATCTECIPKDIYTL